MIPASPFEKRLAHILLSLDGRWLLDWTPRAASHGIVWTFLEANGLLEKANHLYPEGETRLHEFRFHRFYQDYGYCSEADLHHSDRMRFKLVRNPYHRIVTSFLNLLDNRRDFDPYSSVAAEDCTFIIFLRWLSEGNLDRNVHWMPQRQEFETSISFWDFVIRAENIDADLEEINTRWELNLKSPPKKYHHASRRTESETLPLDIENAPLRTILSKCHRTDYYRFITSKTLELINPLFGDDALFYGYEASV